MQSGDPKRIPPLALLLGLLGLIPFIAAALAPWFFSRGQLAMAELAVIGYGAVILSFLGGVHWGLAAGGKGGPTAEASRPLQLLLSVLPALVGWAALLVVFLSNRENALWLLVGSFAVLWAGDLMAAGRGMAPAWYPRLRTLLSLVVLPSLLVTIFL